MAEGVLRKGKFNWGVSVDSLWDYADVPQPKSEIIPYVLSVRMPRGPVEVLEHPQAGDAIKEMMNLPDKYEPEAEVEALCNDLVTRLKEARVGFVRCWFPWNFFFEKEGSTCQFVMDTFVASLKASGIGILGVIGNGYSRFLPEGVGTERLQKYVDQLTQSSSEIVRHYSGTVKTWQIENEPNWWREHLAVRWRSGLIWLEPRAQEEILKSLHDVVREECPDATIVINLEADRGKTDWKFYSKYCDVMGLDFYPGYSHSHKTSADEIRIASEIRNETGTRIIVTETGYPSGPGLLGYSEERQAEYVRSACEVAYSCDAVDALCAWRFADSYWRSFPMQENHFGLLTREREPKAAWFEYANKIKDKSRS